MFNESRVKLMVDEAESREPWDKIASYKLTLYFMLIKFFFKNKWKTNRVRTPIHQR